ncbi:unnamed protein product [Caenorhabditis angaria]|uniref:AB hydrolase-1 domain-containing protein n=1 Tax=Caenorhabditis angaria TaxID=860376 RepID=A0A9P1IJL4_9PELO|nr:unnamed protein product [Caenorhabditis angaria]
MLFLQNKFVVNIIRLYYTLYCIFLLILGFSFKGWKSFQRFIRKKPKCLEGWNSGYLKLKEVRLHYVQTGSDDKPLLLFIHGFPEFWYSWRFQLEEFKNEYRCVAIDQRGYNLSDKPEGKEFYTIDHLVNDVKESIELLGYSSAIIVSHDWGGCVGWKFAEKYPEMCEKLVFMNIPRPNVLLNYIQSNWIQFRKSWYMFFYQTEKFPEMAWTFDDMNNLKLCFRSNQMGLRNKKNFTDEDLEAWKYVFSSNGASFKYPINYYRNLFSDVKAFDKEISLEMPILIIWGDNDGALESNMAKISLKNLKNGRLEFIAGASHWVQQDEPEKCNNLMREFFAEK